MCNNSNLAKVKRHYVLQINGTWKIIDSKDVQKYLDYGCTLKYE